MPQSTLGPASSTRRAALWFALLGGGVAWLGHLLLAYAIAEFGCIAGLGHRTLMGITIVSWLLIAASVLMTLLAIAATVVGWRLRPQWDEDRERELQISGADISGYVARTGWITSALFVLIILAQSLPILFYLGRC